MGKFIERTTMRLNKQTPELRRELVYTLYEVQQPIDKLEAVSVLNKIPALNDYQGDVDNLGAVFDHLEEKGIKCDHVKEYILASQNELNIVPVFFTQCSQNGNNHG
ncbi:hypothetical protein ABKP09_20120 [Peribacillus frigoritolerans]|uniref:hypothetical protein n=1 Tax=Peribacillus frigoritolerans TaxID=450367 RepID=UPI0032B619D6